MDSGLRIPEKYDYGVYQRETWDFIMVRVSSEFIIRVA